MGSSYKSQYLLDSFVPKVSVPETMLFIPYVLPSKVANPSLTFHACIRPSVQQPILLPLAYTCIVWFWYFVPLLFVT